MFAYDAHKGHLKYAWNDLGQALARHQLVRTMVQTDFKSRYKGTLLGAFWLTATAGVTVLGLGVIYAQVFQIDFRSYLPYVAIGMMVWGLINGFVTESLTTFSGTATVFTQIKIPMSVFPMTLTGRLMTTFFYRALVVIVILFIGDKMIAPWQIGASLAGVAIIAWVGFWLAILFGILGARFRDFGQFVNAFMTFAFFMTPVFWDASRLTHYSFVAHFNPLYHFLNIVRGPLIDSPDVGLSFIVAGVFSILLPVVAFGMFAKFRHRLAYWC
ncbi:MAG: ABC transporter permease [Hyphomonas sp.]